MKVLIADTFEPIGIDGLKACGCEVLYEPTLKDESLAAALRQSGAEVLVVRSTRVSAAMLDGGHLSLIVRAGAGYATIDVPAASARGIYVSNCPGKNAVAVAELAFGLILALDRRIPDNVAELRAGRWNKKAFSQAQGLHGRTLGLLGIGSIGQEMARHAAAFGMPVVIWSRRFSGEDRPLSDPEARGLELLSVQHLVPVRLAPTAAAVASRCDVLSVHLALSRETRGLVGRDVLGRLKAGALFINTARGEIVDHAALETVVREKDVVSRSMSLLMSQPAGPVSFTMRSPSCPTCTARIILVPLRAKRRKRSRRKPSGLSAPSWKRAPCRTS